MNRKHLYIFGPYCLSAAERILSENGIRVDLEPLAFNVLLALVKHKGVVISNSDLLEDVWGMETNAGAESVYRQITNVRKALKDDHDEPLYIETSHKKGYRFKAPVKEVKEDWTEAASPQVLLLPYAPDLLIGRDESLRDLKRLLGITLDDRNSVSTPPIVVVRGWPGVGKSSAVAALAHDVASREAFPGGILWVWLGQNPDLPALLATWGRALGTDALLKAQTLKDATLQLASLLGSRRFLLIVDDLWDTAHAAPFQQARGKECILLFTTRETDVAEAIAPGKSLYNLPVLTGTGTTRTPRAHCCR
jgi:DNA-binding winged helix-turn-helix (wHTH) protein